MQALNVNAPISEFEAKQAKGLIGKFKSPLSHVPFKN